MALRTLSYKVGPGVRPSGDHCGYLFIPTAWRQPVDQLCHRSLEGLKEEQEKKKKPVKVKGLKEKQEKKVKLLKVTVDEKEEKVEEDKVKKGRAGHKNQS